MEQFGTIIGYVYEMMNTPINIYGITISYWQIFIWVSVAGILLSFLGGI